MPQKADAVIIGGGVMGCAIAYNLAKEGLKPVVIEKSYLGYALINHDGTIVASSQTASVGRQLTLDNETRFVKSALQAPGFSSVVLPTLLPNSPLAPGGEAIMKFGAALIDDIREPQIVLAFLVDPERGFTEILQRGRLGASGESYAFNASGQLISESRFDDDLRAIGLVTGDERGILNIDIRDPGGNSFQAGPGRVAGFHRRAGRGRSGRHAKRHAAARW